MARWRRRKSIFADSKSSEFTFQFLGKSDNINYVYLQNSQNPSLIPPPLKCHLWKMYISMHLKPNKIGIF